MLRSAAVRAAPPLALMPPCAENFLSADLLLPRRLVNGTKNDYHSFFSASRACYSAWRSSGSNLNAFSTLSLFLCRAIARWRARCAI